MKTAVFDNPATMCREMWQDGKLLAHLSADAMLQKGFRGHPTIPLPLNCGEWCPGRVDGDAAAIAEFDDDIGILGKE